jgi:AcrR family transcriptional regulator
MTARDAILDAAARVILDQGIARATTKEIAREAGYSEALLYKHFADKQEIFLAVLSERVPPIPGVGDLRPDRPVAENLERLVEALLRFYLHSFPMAASLFGERRLLAPWRAGLAERGAGPRGPVLLVRDYLRSEKDAGRLPRDLDPVGTAELLAGGALQQAFFAAFAEDREFADAPVVARRLVAALRL